MVSLTFVGSGGAHSEDLGNSSAIVDVGRGKGLVIDVGPETFFELRRQGYPFDAVFITHAHLDHTAGLERLFFARAFSNESLIKMFVPAELVLRLHQVLGLSGTQVAEGGRHFWDCFQLIPVGTHFYYGGKRFNVFPARHHFPGEAFGLGLPGYFVYTGDTRPIPEQLVAHAGRGEIVFHDASISSNPSHSGVDDLEKEYWAHDDILDRLVLYHFSTNAERKDAESRGWKTASPNQRFMFSSGTSRPQVGRGPCPPAGAEDHYRHLHGARPR